MLQDIVNFIWSILDLWKNVFDLLKHLFTSLWGLFEWIPVALDFSRDIVNYVPGAVGAMFMAMTALSVVFVIFGRIK